MDIFLRPPSDRDIIHGWAFGCSVTVVMYVSSLSTCSNTVITSFCHLLVTLGIRTKPLVPVQDDGELIGRLMSMTGIGTVQDRAGRRVLRWNCTCQLLERVNAILILFHRNFYRVVPKETQDTPGIVKFFKICLRIDFLEEANCWWIDAWWLEVVEACLCVFTGYWSF